MPAPQAPAVLLDRRGTIEDDALGERLIVLKKEHDRLVEELLTEREAEDLLRAAHEDRALLDEGRLVSVAAGVAAVARRWRAGFLFLGDQSRAHLTPVELVHRDGCTS